MKLTVGFSTRDDRMAWMTANLLMEQHGDLIDELLIIDNSPDGSEYAAQLEKMVRDWPRVRYVRVIGPESSCLYKDKLFRESRGDWTLCVDSHVWFKPEALAALRAHAERDRDSRDLLMGPCMETWQRVHGTNQMIYADEPYSLPSDAKVHQGVVCRGGAVGVWVLDPRAEGDEPFEIMQQGTGAFCMRTAAWPGFHPGFIGHGGNETYLMELVRQRGGRVMCLPQLRWVHCFMRSKADIPYRVDWTHRVRNYLVGFRAIGREDLYLAASEHFQTICPRSYQTVARALEKERR